MPSKAKEEQQKLEQQVRMQSHDPGVRALHEWLKLKQAEVNGRWTRISGEELLQMQGFAQALAEAVRVIEHGPKIAFDPQGRE